MSSITSSWLRNSPGPTSLSTVAVAIWPSLRDQGPQAGLADRAPLARHADCHTPPLGSNVAATEWTDCRIYVRITRVAALGCPTLSGSRATAGRGVGKRPARP